MAGGRRRRKWLASGEDMGLGFISFPTAGGRRRLRAFEEVSTDGCHCDERCPHPDHLVHLRGRRLTSTPLAGATLVKGPPLTSSSTSSVSSAFSALAAYGWDEAWASEFAPHEPEGLLPGRVIRVDRGQCDVVTADGVVRADTAFVTPHDPLRVVCTGDWVAVEPAGNHPRYVRTCLPRRTAFVRSTSSKRSEGQILAANVDHAIVAVSLAVELDLGRIERFLALAWESAA